MQSDDDPLERIYYTDGQRLSEELLRKEQDYHLRLQRLLSKSLFTPGVAAGLDVKLEQSGKVTVAPGLALDSDGHALVLVAPRELPKVDGKFLTIRFGERGVREASDGCRVAPASPGGHSVPTSWRGPTLFRLEPELRFRNRLPEDKLELVLAEFAFDSNCVPTGIVSGPRLYATATQFAKIHTFAFEGEKDIDPTNPKRIYFHIRGRTPTSVVLYLRAAEAPSMFRELPAHDHLIAGTTTSAPVGGVVDPHTHPIPHSHGHSATVTARATNRGVRRDELKYLTTGRVWDQGAINAAIAAAAGSLNASVMASLAQFISDAFPPGGATEQNLSDLVGMSIAVTEESQQNTSSGDVDAPPPQHVHQVPGQTISAGQASLSSPTGLRIWLGTPTNTTGVDITEAVRGDLFDPLDPLKWAPAGGGLDWNKLKEGTGAIKLHMLRALSSAIGQGEFWIELKLAAEDDDRVGGRVYYNLYVEAEAE